MWFFIVFDVASDAMCGVATGMQLQDAGGLDIAQQGNSQNNDPVTTLVAMIGQLTGTANFTGHQFRNGA